LTRVSTVTKAPEVEEENTDELLDINDIVDGKFIKKEEEEEEE
jgi:hypothetical protein